MIAVITLAASHLALHHPWSSSIFTWCLAFRYLVRGGPCARPRADRPRLRRSARPVGRTRTAPLLGSLGPAWARSAPNCGNKRDILLIKDHRG